jgi:cytochrome c5
VTQTATGEAQEAAVASSDQAASPSPESEAAAESEESVAQATAGEASQAEAATPDQAASPPPESEPAAESVVPADLDLAQGEETYNTVCSVCHAQGVANAPKLGDKDAWDPRIAKGWDILVEHALKGFNAMPAKGGRVDLADDQIITAVGYMVVESK